ncbi:MAG: class I SAM-dependent methyltransferase [Chloroflexi bacterium]|nr:class I SAM-dependent methyltransferase [Chloroflexota bacterium]
MEEVRCNLCGGDSTVPVAQINGFNIVRCQHCGLTYVNPRLNIDEVHAIYDERYYRNEGLQNGNGSQFFGYDDYLGDEENIRLTFAKRLRTIEVYVERGRLLDIGCATGFFLNVARDHGWDVVGTEVSEYSVDYARSHFGLDVRLGTLRDIRFESDTFDVVTMWDVIEHLTDPMGELQEIRRILRPGGLLSIITPNVDSLVARVLGPRWEEFRRVREHLYFFSPRTLAAMLDRVGFVVLKTESADKFFYLGPAVRRMRYYLWDSVATDILYRIVHRLRLDKVRLNVNPFTKVALYARKE